jgi:hypothetical protein
MYIILITKQKLKHYFELHHVTTVTILPLGEVIHNIVGIRRIAKWALELMGYKIFYVS